MLGSGLQPEPFPARTDRRSAPRQATVRRVMFYAERERGFLKEGTTFDVGCAGLGIRTRSPEQPGERLQLEIEPKSGAGQSCLILARGRVTRVNELVKGEYAMGVRITVPLRIPDGAAALRPMCEARAERAKPSPEGSYWAVSQAGAGAEPTTGQQARRKARFVLLGALLLLLFVGRVWRFARLGGAAAGAIVAARDGGTDSATNYDRPHSGSSHYAQFTSGLTAARKIPFDSASEWHRHSFWAGFTPDSEGFKERREKVRAVLHYRDHARPENGQPALTERSIRGVQAASGCLEGRDRTEIESSFLGSLVPDHSFPENAGDWAPPPDFLETLFPFVASEHSVHSSDMWVIVDKDDFVLTVFKDGEQLCSFPVGLGRGDSTPEGRFEIVTKMTDPVWYNRGRGVKAGAAGNPLGRRWLGLADAAGPTCYGIHPTNDPEDIGRASSQGCIRMRPEDAETLFRLCPVGTPVRICS